MFTFKSANPAIVLWMDHGEKPTEFSFRDSIVSSTLSRHSDINDAVDEVARKIADGSSERRQPWIFCEKVVFGPKEIQTLENQMADSVIDHHMAQSHEAVRRYYADWG